MMKAGMRVNLLISILLIAFALGGCGPTLKTPTVSPYLLQQEAELQREYTYKTIVERKIKLQRIYTPLRIANADICGRNVSPVTGIFGIDLHSLDMEMRPIAQRLHGVGDGIKILDVVPNSPAAEGALSTGDVIAGAAKGKGIMPSGWSYSGLTIPDLVKVIESSDAGPITLLVRREGNTFPLTVTPRFGCSYPIELKFDLTLNAAADGTKIIVNTGTFNHIPDDRQVAFLIGHELAHNILEHVQKKQGNAAVGMAAGAVFDIGLAVIGVNTQGLGMRTGAEAGVKAYSKEFESEADYLGLYLLARAGFDISVASDLFRRMGTEKPSAQVQVYSSTHPSTPERAAAMQQAMLEIQGKTATQQALLPATLPGEAFAVKAPELRIAQSTQQAATAPIIRPVTSFTPTASPGLTPSVNQPAPARATTGASYLAQMYLVKGRIVSNPPQAYSAKFFMDTRKASVALSGQRLVNGEFDQFGMNESIGTKYKASLIKPDTLKPFPGADAKGFALFSDVDLQIECAYALTEATGRGEGTCADNQGNTYRIVFQ